MTAKHGSKAQVLITSQPSLAISNMVLTDSGDHKTFTTPTAQAAKRQWDSTVSFVFQTTPDGGTTWNTATPSIVQYVGGQITFASAVSGTTPGARVQSGSYLPYAAVATATGWSPDVSRDIKENTTLTTSGSPTRWKAYQPGLLSGTFHLDGFQADPTYIGLLTATTPLVLSLVIDVTTGSRIEAACLVQKDSFKTSLTDLETENVDFVINGAVYVYP